MLEKRNPDLAKVGVEGSNPFARSRFCSTGESLAKARREGGFFVSVIIRKARKKFSSSASATADRAMRFFAVTDVLSFFGLRHLNSD